jgi:DNA-binding HxlR family transcriptional regulator
MIGVRTYDQFCGLARALDLVGDRWTLLIVRELLIQQPCRYTDLRYGLPGIATNLLADRLRELEANGIISRELAPPPVATTLFRLTERGEGLRPVLEALGRWGAPLLEATSQNAEFRSHWLTLPLELLLRDHRSDRPAVTIELETGEQSMLITTVDGGVRVTPGTTSGPDARLRGAPDVAFALLSGKIDLATAGDRGLEFEGDRDALRRIQPLAVAHSG